MKGAKGTNITVDTLCRIMTSKEDALSKYSQINDLILNTYGMKCLDVAFSDFVKSMQQTSWESSASEGGVFFIQLALLNILFVICSITSCGRYRNDIVKLP